MVANWTLHSSLTLQVIENTPTHRLPGSDLFIRDVLVLDLHQTNGFRGREATLVSVIFFYYSKSIHPDGLVNLLMNQMGLLRSYDLNTLTLKGMNLGCWQMNSGTCTWSVSSLFFSNILCLVPRHESQFPCSFYPLVYFSPHILQLLPSATWCLIWQDSGENITHTHTCCYFIKSC